MSDRLERIKKIIGDGSVSAGPYEVTGDIAWLIAEIERLEAEMIEMVNERIRGEAARNAERSIGYLNGELEKTSVVEAQQVIYGLIEAQLNNAMLANVQREYAFRVIDHAVPPEIKVRPRRTIMVIVGALTGLLFGLVVVFFRRVLVKLREDAAESSC